jgi:hypothetical protein
MAVKHQQLLVFKGVAGVFFRSKKAPQALFNGMNFD